MKRLLPWMIALTAWQGATLYAQNVIGDWQGTLQAGKELRIVVKISTTDNDALKAVMYSIDQGGQPIPATVTRQGSGVKMTVPAINGAYEGKVSADGNSIAGTWTQGPAPLPLNLKRATPETAWAIPEPPPPPKRMPADAKPVFEVSTIKPSNPSTPGKAFTFRGRSFVTINTTLGDMIDFAYGVHPRQVVGGPAWLETDKYDLTAQPDIDGQPNTTQLKTMLQQLLADRFKLTLHHDKKELSAYAIVVAKTGPKLTKSEGDPNGLPGLFFQGLGVLPARNATMSDFAGVMQGAVLDRPVVDQTGIAGRWDFTLKWTPDQTQFLALGGVHTPPPADNADAPPDLFTAIQQQLGLRLESTKAPIDVLVIDHVDKPSEN